SGLASRVLKGAGGPRCRRRITWAIMPESTPMVTACGSRGASGRERGRRRIAGRRLFATAFGENVAGGMTAWRPREAAPHFLPHLRGRIPYLGVHKYWFPVP